MAALPIADIGHEYQLASYNLLQARTSSHFLSCRDDTRELQQYTHLYERYARQPRNETGRPAEFGSAQFVSHAVGVL